MEDGWEGGGAQVMVVGKEGALSYMCEGGLAICGGKTAWHS